MSLIYIGNSGLLNEKLHERLRSSISNIFSARSFSINEISEHDVIIWGGRYLEDDFLSKLNKNNKLIYISTYIYNDFCDNYQVRKLLDSVKVDSMRGQSLHVPFIKEFHCHILDKITVEEDSIYYTYCTDLDEIAKAIIDFDKSQKLSLIKERVNLQLSLRERVLWRTFSLFYRNKKRVEYSTIDLFYLNAVKALEKTLHRILHCHGLSAVYIKKDLN
ncbi:hypothetical protein [Photobacterium arenosum]|uniref:hypothetical protein n=1 Tax=Photobacterium arenosum TaxID=2774143 RepID=UPI002889186B|nr:hypothetical protein [Photobacterium arenosum]